MSVSNVKQIGIVGGGASTLMLCMEAAKLGIRTCLLDPEINCVGSRIASEHIIAPITNENIKKLSLRCDRVIYNTRTEFELDVKLHSTMYPNKEVINELYNFKNVMDILELLEIPTAKIFYQDNGEEAFNSLEGLSMPFRYIKLYENYSKQIDVFEKEDLAEFIMEVDEQAQSFILQPLSDYKQIVACICMVDTKGKIYQYHPIEEIEVQKDICHLRMDDTFTKTMLNKLSRYNRKLLKEINAQGVFTIKYGVKANKAVEFIEITPELGIGSLLTLEAYDTSVFEQYIRFILDMKVVAPELTNFAHGTVSGLNNEIDKNEVGHIYHCGIANFCIQRGKKQEE